jgi:glycosyltransferase involved in cell wall biosynthesis
VVSVIIATRNRCGLLDKALRALTRQTCAHSSLEIIVADNGSTDRTREVVEAYAHTVLVRYLSVPDLGKSHAINAGLAAATGDVIALTDDDVVPAAGWIDAIGEAFEREECDFVAGRVIPLWEVEPPKWLSPALHGVLAVRDNGIEPRWLDIGENTHIMPIGANMAVRANVFKRLGGLRTDLGKLEGTLRTGEDHELYLRLLHAGCRGLYEPRAVVEHYEPESSLIRAYIRKWLFQNGQIVAQLEMTYPRRTTRLLRVPRYLWRAAAQDARRWTSAKIQGHYTNGFTAAMRMTWFAGYLRAAWFGAAQAAESPLCVNESRSSLRTSA